MGEIMDDKDRKDFNELKGDVRDIYANQNELGEDMHDIKTNHLPHINLKINITLGGLVFIAIMIAILGCMIAWGVGII